jgi:hypothetical protein
MGEEDQGSEVRVTTRLIHRHHGAIALILVVLAASVTTAQQSGRSKTETLTTLRNRDLNGAVTVSEQTVTHRTRADDGDQVVIESYSPSMEGGRLALSRRVRRTMTATNNGSQTVEETEERNPVAPGEPLRMVRRSVTTVLRSGTDSYVSERQVFELDTNGRLVPVLTETEHAFRQ